jgi:hypothetical protein
MTGMGRPKHFEPPSKWVVLAVFIIILICWVSKDFLP